MLWTNLRNQVRQKPLPKWKPLIPLFEPVLQNLRRLLAVTDPTRRWISAIGLAVAVGIAYFLAARLSLSLLTKSDGVAVFWPASGVAAGALIALGPGARWPVAIGAMAATIVANLLGDRTFAGATTFALCNAGEAMLTAGLIERRFGSDFSLERLRDVLGLVAAAVFGPPPRGSVGLWDLSCSTARRHRA